jgi:hypothetical protein
MPLDFEHLSEADHTKAANLLIEIQDNLTALSCIVQRAPVSDLVLRIQSAVQSYLIDPLRHARGTANEGYRKPGQYPNVGHAARPIIKG